ncbi:uncharacterized protein [Venturia canescens]|uniref:uncharacterized protein n=1 Tax=Venturia canescens TaxID=32260 RepID=UPI001C9CFEEB|nr:uncharacterized protein LOC122408313 [Venturia canescens]
MSNNSETTTRLATDSEDNLTSDATNETMYTALSKEESIPTMENYVDESQAVVLASDLKIYQPTLAGGDAAKETLSHEKWPCNAKCELEVKPKIAALEKERRELALKSNVESLQQQRSLRTRSRRTNSTFTKDANLNDAENVDPELVRTKDEPIVDFTGSFDFPDTKLSLKLNETRTRSSKVKNITTKFADAAILAEHRKDKDKVPNPPDASKVVNPCYRGLKKGATKPWELDCERNSRRRECWARSLDDEGVDEKAEKMEQKYSEKHGQNMKGAKGIKSKQRLLNLEEQNSSDSSLIDSSNESRSRRQEEQDYSQSKKRTSEKSPTRKRFKEEEREAGPSGIRNPENDHRHELDDDFSDDDVDNAWDVLPESHQNSNLYRRPVDTKKQQINRDKTRSKKKLTGSRVRIWRAGLTADMGERDPRVRGSPFSIDEQEIMIKYLLQNGKVRYAKGLVVWKQLIHDGLLPHTTPQSLHNHFTKIILPKIENFKKLTAVELQIFLNVRKEKRQRKR